MGFRAIGSGSTIAAYVASRREPLRVDDLLSGDQRFPEALGGTGTRLPDCFLSPQTGVGAAITPSTAPTTPTPNSTASTASIDSCGSVGTGTQTLSTSQSNSSASVESTRAIQQVEKREVRSVLVYPISVDDTLVGVLEAYRFVGRIPFTIDHETVSSRESAC